MNHSTVSNEQRLLTAVLQAERQDPCNFELAVLAGGALRIKGPFAAACYPPAHWVERFTMHLRQGYFTRAAPALPRLGIASAADGWRARRSALHGLFSHGA